mgnify:CR=1 FL=1
MIFTIRDHIDFVKKSQKAYDTQDSQAVSDPSTNWAQRCLTLQIGRDAVYSTRYGRKRKKGNFHRLSHVHVSFFISHSYPSQTFKVPGADTRLCSLGTR